MFQKSYDGKGILYLIPTPIGNMEDITIRALNILKSVDFVLCEDTRVTSVLLKKYNINKKLIRCDEYFQSKVEQKVVSALESGLCVGLVSDAGSPVISDPGYILARSVISAGYNVVALPGATAFVPALSVSGINPSPFVFYGFLNSKSAKRKKELEKLKNHEETIIFYESPHRIIDTLKDILIIFGDRNISISRELTKIHEEIFRGKVSESINNLSSLKGEFVIVVDGCHDKVDFSNLSILEHINIYIEDGYSNMEAIKLVAKERNVPKSVIYNEYNKNK